MAKQTITLLEKLAQLRKGKPRVPETRNVKIKADKPKSQEKKS